MRMLARFKLKSSYFNRRQTDNLKANMQDRPKLKTAPSHYPQLLFRSLQVLQLISAIGVTIIMSWFIYHLRDSSMAVPWKFIFLFIVSLLTVLVLVANIVIYLPTCPPALQNAFVNGTLLLLWIAAFTILAIAMNWTLQRACTIADWDTDTGMTVCRVYKALFAFALAELPITFLALCLDLVVRRQETFSGAYVRAVDPLRGQFDPYSESKRLTEPVPSPRVLSAEYGLRKDDHMESLQKQQMEMEPLNEVEQSGLGMVHKAPSIEERRYDGEDEDIGYNRSGRESTHDVLRA